MSTSGRGFSILWVMVIVHTARDLALREARLRHDDKVLRSKKEDKGSGWK